MSVIETGVLALALSMDAFAVALATGLRIRCGATQTLRMGLAFGLFQFLMPLVGWYLGTSVRVWIEAIDHWVAFGLLALVGGHMIYEALQNTETDDCADPTQGTRLLILAVATSIDALAIGISLAMVNVDIWQPAVIIGMVCFIMTVVGLQIGRVVLGGASRLSTRANVLGGLVLIGIGTKILFEHGVFG